MSFQWVDIHLHTTSSQCIYIYEAACTVHTNYTQGIGWTTQCMANDCAFLSVYIYTWWQVGMCERWEVWNPTRSRYTLGGIHTLPLTLGQRSSHTTRRPLPLVCPGPQPPSPTPVFSLFPLFSHGVTSFFSSFPFSDNHYWTNLFLLHIFKKLLSTFQWEKRLGKLILLKVILQISL